jgi:SpoVK/Ycf46/Vps4 family AAA+-type ATPase
LQNYVNSLDIANNFVKLDPYGDLRATSRRKVPFNIKNFDKEAIITEMKKCLEHGKRRGYMFMGDPGTGKTESIQKLLEQFTDLPVFWVDSSSLSSYTAIHEVFKTLHYFPKSICVFDDIDALDLTAKSDKTTAFIECMDCKDDKLAYNGIVIMTVNEPTRVHSSIKSRPGRIDKIIYIKNPETLESVFDVITQRYVRADCQMPSEFRMTSKKFVACMQKCIDANFTHAHIAGIIDDIIYLSDTTGKKLLTELSSRIDDRIMSIKYANMKTKNGYFEKGSLGD